VFLQTTVILRDYASFTEVSLQDVKYFDRASSSIKYSDEVQKAQLSVTPLALSVAAAHRNQVVSRISAPRRSAAAA